MWFKVEWQNLYIPDLYDLLICLCMKVVIFPADVVDQLENVTSTALNSVGDITETIRVVSYAANRTE